MEEDSAHALEMLAPLPLDCRISECGICARFRSPPYFRHDTLEGQAKTGISFDSPWARLRGLKSVGSHDSLMPAALGAATP